jgi:peptidyl-prolyl cis-trans isomerase B (cyclophilin B)
MKFSARLALSLTLSAAVMLAAPVYAGKSTHHHASKKPEKAPIVKMVTDKGTILIKLFPIDAPITVANFEKLVNKGFYNGLTFHRVESNPDFRLIQGGDPRQSGRPGLTYQIKGEFSSNGVTNPLVHNAGAVAMARTSDPNSADCQFYICINPVHQLDGNYAVFGQVVKGLEAANKIVVGDKMTKVTMMK